MGNDLDGSPKIIAVPFACDDIGVNPAGGDVVAFSRGNPRKPLVVAEIEVGLRTVIGHVDLTVLVRAHRAGIDIDVRVQFAQPYLETACL